MDRDYLLFFEGETEMKVPSELNLQCGFSVTSYLFITELKSHMTCYNSMLERTYKPHYHYQNFSPMANGTDLNREKYAILQTHWH